MYMEAEELPLNNYFALAVGLGGGGVWRGIINRGPDYGAFYCRCYLLQDHWKCSLFFMNMRIPVNMKCKQECIYAQ